MILYLAVGVFSRDWDQIIHASRVGTRVSFYWILSIAFEMAWKAGLVLLVWSGFDYLLQKINFERELRMSREDIKEEVKETEGNPIVRLRIKRLQRQMREKRMTQDVSKATVVVTNPNHFAVAIQYQPEEMDAPRVLAKGQNLLAQEIKKIARWNEIPIVENAPLAQALYRAVDVGQTIPAKLYTAVAEILAFIYRAQAQMGGTGMPGQRAERPTGV
jgi:flagellar biosynthetic protein FlhB